MKNERKTLTLNINKKLNININNPVRHSFKPKEPEDRGDLKSLFRKTSFSNDNTNFIKDRSIKNLDAKKTDFKADTEKQQELAQNEEIKTQFQSFEKKEELTNKIDTHKILSEFAKKQKEEDARRIEEEKKRREEEKQRKDLARRRKQEEQLKQFNARGKNKQFDNNEKSDTNDKNNNAKTDEKKPQKEEKHFSNNKQKISSNKKSNKKYNNKDFDNEENNNKKRNRKITYVLNDDDEELFSRRRNKNYFKNKEKTSTPTSYEKVIQEVELPEFITVADLAEKMNEKKADVVKKLISLGMVCTVNQTIDADTAELVIGEFGHKVKKRTTEHDIENKLDEEVGTKFVSRAPVVTIMGHVDHGKTSILDAIRTTKVAESESGGITQHIGASRVEADNGKFITFIDTPGHEAFTEMRMRGAKITDIVVLVVAADDGVKEQTIEAISHSKQAGVPIILAINKIDKPDANPQRVKQELLQYDVVTEDFGGDVISVEVSAKEKIGLDKLKEAILLQAEVLDLKAPIDVRASGVVIEAKMDQKKGPVASLLVQKGVLKNTDLVLVGTSYGKIKKMVDDKNKSQLEVMPSMAVEILGLNSVPSAGEQFYVLDSEKEIRDIIAYRSRKELENKVAKRSTKSLDSMLKIVGGKSAKLLSVIIKADVNGSLEAISNTLRKLNTEEVEIDIVHSATGAINESDVNLASISNAVIIGFNVRANSSAVELAKNKEIDIRYYSIIYNIVDDIKNILSGMLDPLKKEEILGHCKIKQVFKIAGIGKVAGAFVDDGEINRNSRVRVIRDGIVIYDGEIKALKRFKDDVKEVKNGYECGISIENYDNIKEGDVIESYKIIEEKRTL